MSAVATISLCSAARLTHLENQLAATAGAAHRIVVWLGTEAPPALESESVLWCPPGPHGMRLAAARNQGADEGVRLGYETLVFLDADCIPGSECLGAYARGLADRPGAIACGPVTYLPDGFQPLTVRALQSATDPHPARPAPAVGEVVTAAGDEYSLFWSLSFAVSAKRWRGGPRFDERFEGYGAEDTDFAWQARERSVPLVWVGGADAYHQYHSTQTPPWQHLDDILRNGATFAEKWGEWPMAGWLSAFEAAGAVRRLGNGWVRSVA